ncbi:uncharacterized protein PV07_04788 [Cladophialophora immunda]|uniref:Uncharacterized protein n=1 Tax=Cladophialophora immunda TaxID=569365 RepID=A0A0D1ZLW0_9EURO|nr:uncharacterized protein PV07_04788 [Cladophialophora immunda]KIW28936.1 hypothetical protein PV07_04788 [Cladophialophora immunda]
MTISEDKPGFVVAIIAGGTAGGVEAAMTYPFEFAKTRVQLRNGLSSVKLTSNPFRILREIVRGEGFRSIYKGCSSLVVGSIGKDAIRFLAFDSIKHKFADPTTGSLGAAGNMMAGVASGIIASTVIVTPSERIKTALIDDARSSHRFQSTLHAIRLIFRESGFVGLYRGYVGTTLKQTGTTAFRLGSYNIMKDMYRRHDIKQGPGLDFVTGAAAGLATTLATQPFDVVKTRSQTAKGSSTKAAIKDVYFDSGVLGFWKGTTMRLSRTVLSGAILFTVYEQMVAILNLMPNVVSNAATSDSGKIC